MADLFSGASAQIVPFKFGAHELRVIQRDGEPWFVASDVATSLDYRDAHNAARQLGDHQRGTHIMSTPSGDQRITVINESGLYRLVLRSRKPEAVAFSDWVTGEVLPAIRKTGNYHANPDRLKVAMEAANAVAAKVQACIFEQLATGSKEFLHDRFMLSFSLTREGSVPSVRLIESDAMVMSLERLAKAILDPGGMMPSNTELANLATACNQRLSQRMQYQAKKVES